MLRNAARKDDTPAVENPPGIFRTTIAYNDALMLCHFTLRKGSRIPLHEHAAAQNGYLISGRMRMIWEDGREFLADPARAGASGRTSATAPKSWRTAWLWNASPPRARSTCPPDRRTLEPKREYDSTATQHFAREGVSTTIVCTVKLRARLLFISISALLVPVLVAIAVAAAVVVESSGRSQDARFRSALDLIRKDISATEQRYRTQHRAAGPLRDTPREAVRVQQVLGLLQQGHAGR